ncbi:DEAD/DEAH box helicase [Hyphococcus lacteus]|uniref:DEAD/DEAH box helicase n=1 Tax=Hyphococcus lacteus TaxID=3143536 RepID=A0ABV3Z7D0_9PROT
MTQFSDFGLARPIMQALADEKHTTPTPIQNGAIPVVMNGRDLLGIAQTGTGKTAAFALPILHKLAETSYERRPGDCRVLVLTPTRELSAQVLERFKAYGRRLNLRMGLVIGGAPMGKQKAMTRKGLDVLVATPGRLVDLINQKAVDLSRVEAFVLDEVDQMLDLGFIHAIRTISQKLPAKRQNIFFSATMPPEIAKFANKLLTNPTRVEIEAEARPRIDQSVRFIDKGAKAAALLEIVKTDEFTRGLVFTRTKHGADKVVRMLEAAGARAYAIHGNRSQAQRERALAAFRTGKARILVATDIAARGIDVREVSHVVNYDLPNVPETYVHRIGRTARAGAAGVAVSFCSNDERPFLRSIEKLTREKITVTHGEDIAYKAPKRAANDQRRKKPRRNHGAPKKPFKNEKRTSAEGSNVVANDEKRKENGERGTTRVRRRRNRGPAGRKLSSHAG